jgi:hypothetical protein
MSYYQELVKNIGKAMRKHPRSVVAMDSKSFKVMATGKNSAALSQKLNRGKATENVSVIFQKPSAGAVWIL